MKHIRVVVADNHALVRSGLCALLNQMEEVEVVAEAANGREAVRLTEVHRPDVVLMDIAMPELNGLDATRRIAKKVSHVQVLLVSMYNNEEYVAEALTCGAAGYMLKDSDAAEFRRALLAVARGDSYLSPAVAKLVITGATKPGEDGRAGLGRVTTRQREVLQSIAEGRSTKQIAAELQLSAKTVEKHRADLMDRLDIHDVAGLVRFAVRTGLVAPEYTGR